LHLLFLCALINTLLSCPFPFHISIWLTLTWISLGTASLDVILSGPSVRLGNLPKKKNIHRDLQVVFKGFNGIVNIRPAVSGNRKTRDPICKGFLHLLNLCLRRLLSGTQLVLEICMLLLCSPINASDFEHVRRESNLLVNF